MNTDFFSLVIAISMLICGCTQTPNVSAENKVKGLVFTGPGNGPYKSEMFTSMTRVNGNYVALVPEATVFRQNLNIQYDFERQWYGETKRALFDGIQLARANELKIMIKPHLTVQWDMSNWNSPELDMNDSISRSNYFASYGDFIRSQESKVEGSSSWRGEFMTKTDKDWETFEEGYITFILDYAQIADSLGVEMFCVGTEMKRVALEKPDFFRRLVGEVRNIYSGEIIYAANWDSYNKIEFWDDLDHIGVDAYFPISDEQEPTLDEMKASWKLLSKDLSDLSKSFGKPIIFTEWGYEDEYYVGKEPWIMTKMDMPKNESLQALAYKSMFEVVWDEPWMKGVFVWRWEPYIKSKLPQYSPTGKDAAKVLENWYSSTN